MSKELDALTQSLVHAYAEKLSKHEQEELMECLEVIADDQKYNKFANFLPDKGQYRRELYPKHCDFFKAGAEYRERFFVAANRVGKCLKSLQKLELADGTITTVLEQYKKKKPFKVIAWDEENKCKVVANASPIFKKDKKEECVNVVFSDGTILGCALDHRILTNDGWMLIRETGRFDGYALGSNVQPYDVSTVFGVRIVSLQLTGIEAVYDFEVEKYHNYIIGGIVNHNSEAGSFETVCHVTGIYPDWWEGKRYKAPILAWVGGDTATTCRDIIQKKLIGDITDQGSGMIPRDLIVDIKTRRNVPEAIETIRVRHVSGGHSTIVIKTYEQGRASWQGSEVDWVWIDEESPSSVYGEALIRLMTTNGSIITTFTPLSGVTELVLSALENDQHSDAKFPKYVQVVAWDDVPHITEEMKEQMLEATPPQLREARSKGIPTVGEGLVYPVDPKNITVDDFILPKHFKKLYGMDVGWNATAAVWGAWDVDNDIIYIYSEHKQGQAEPVIHAKAIKARGEWIRGEIDPAARGRSQVDGESLFRLYKEEGLKIYPANNAVEAGIFNIWERMGTGRLKIFKSCTGILRELSLYHRDDKGKIVKTNDHICLASNTLIKTLGGDVEICKLTSSDIVVNCLGYCVTTTGGILVEKDAEFVEVVTRKAVERVTVDHSLLAVDGLWYPAYISKGINLIDMEELCLGSFQKHSRNLTEKHTGSVDSIFSDTEKDFIELFGSQVVEQYLMGTLSIIKTLTDQTIQSKTLSAFYEENIKASTQEDLLSWELLQNHLSKPLMQQQNGMALKMVRTGTKNIMKSLSICSIRKSTENVRFAERFIQQLDEVSQTAFALIVANQHLEGKTRQTTFSSIVRFVEKNFTLQNILQRRHVQELVEANNVATLFVQTVNKLPKADAWCLYEKEANSFVLSSGIVSENCDCLRYLINAHPSAWSYETRPNKPNKVLQMNRYMNACV